MTNSVYPSALDSFDLPSDPENTPLGSAGDGALDLPDTLQKIINAVTAIQGELGLDPAGAVATVRARIDTLASDVLSVLTFKGTWNASTNSPDLSALSPDVGDVYIVTVAGSTSLGGVTDWKVGDWALYTGAWEKVDHTDAPHASAHLAGGSDALLTQANLEAAGVILARVPIGAYAVANGFTFGASIPPEATLRLAPIYLPAGTYDQIGAEVTIVGTAGAVVRLGVCEDDGTGKPGDVVLDAGTIDGTLAAIQDIVTSFVHPGGWVWAGAAIQGGAGTRPTLRTIGNIIAPLGTTASALSNYTRIPEQSSVSGALPATYGGSWPASSVITSAPIVRLRRSA